MMAMLRVFRKGMAHHAPTLSVLFLLVLTTDTLTLASSNDTGRLVFTDYLKPDYVFTVDVFDLEQNTRTSLPFARYGDAGFLWPIDDEHVYVSMCLSKLSLLCTASISEIITVEQLSQFVDAEKFWQEEYHLPEWSPDGTRIAFVLVREGTNEHLLRWGDIHVIDSDGSNMLDLTPDEDNDGYSFTWSPDSQQIAFACHAEEYLCISDVDANNLRRITMPENSDIRDLTWSPDGSQIVFSLKAEGFRNAELFVINADGTDLHRLLEAGEDFHENPVWSPDGSKIVFRSGEERNNIGEIYVIDSDGTNLHNLSESLNANEFAPAWSPDGMSVAFFSARYGEDSGTSLYVTSADGTNLREITDNSSWELTDTGSPDLFWIP